MSKQRWTEVEARKIFGSWRESGLTLHAFAKSRGLSPERLYRWHRRLGGGAKLAMVPVQVTETTSRKVPVTVVLRTGHMLKVGRDFDEEAFRRAVQVLESC